MVIGFVQVGMNGVMPFTRIEMCIRDRLCLVRGAAVHNRQFYFIIASRLLRKGFDFVDGLHPSKRLPDRIIAVSYTHLGGRGGPCTPR